MSAAPTSMALASTGHQEVWHPGVALVINMENALLHEGGLGVFFRCAEAAGGGRNALSKNMLLVEEYGLGGRICSWCGLGGRKCSWTLPWM
uniref:Uncharacterized protein n=1 Tax=Meloidogyne hapla TaxID=6305 RepID=A0A1I8BNT4_MELHA